MVRKYPLIHINFYCSALKSGLIILHTVTIWNKHFLITMKQLLSSRQDGIADVFTFIYNEMKFHTYQRPKKVNQSQYRPGQALRVPGG